MQAPGSRLTGPAQALGRKTEITRKAKDPCLCSTPALTFHGDVLNGESKDDRPDHAQRHFQVPIYNFWNSRMGGSLEKGSGMEVPVDNGKCYLWAAGLERREESVEENYRDV